MQKQRQLQKKQNNQGEFMLFKNVIAKANSSNNAPVHFAKKAVLKFVSNATPKDLLQQRRYYQSLYEDKKSNLQYENSEN